MWRFASVAVLIGLFWLVANGTAERAILYPFDPSPAPPPAGITAMSLTTEDGETLVVWTAPPARLKPVVLYLSGNAGNLATRAARFRAITANGFGLVAPAYRGASGSTGTPSEAALTADALAVMAAVPRLARQAPVVIYGESLGAAVALAVAEQHPPAALVLEAPFASVAAEADALYHMPSLARLMKSKWDSLDRISRITAPLLILHGTDDTVVPIAQGRALYEAAASRDKTFLAVPGAGHLNRWQPDVQRTLFTFLRRF
jgi:hypothetical protein